MADENRTSIPTRRQFLTGAGAIAGGLLVARTPAAAAVAAPEAPAPEAAPAFLRYGLGTQQAVTRYDVTTFTPGSQQLASLQRGVAAMKARPSSDPTSWAAQANVHAVFCDNPPAGITRVHYSWRFLPWHRAYLYYFEKIVRAASGDPTLSLPYWNWSTNLQIPSQYWGTSNPLFDPRRTKGPNDRLDPRNTAIANLLRITSFPPFGGEEPEGNAGALEVGPHNYVHGWIGGDMGRFSTAALDPVFWAHHANVDRVWYLWNREGNANPGGSWLTTSYPFYDIDRGAMVDVPFAQAASFPVVYAAPPAQVLAVSDPAGSPRIDAGQTTAPVAISAGAVENVLGAMPGPAATLRVVGATLPADEAVTVHVLARPQAGAAAPTDDQAFAGSFTLVPTGPHHAQHPPVNVHVALGTGFLRAVMANQASGMTGGAPQPASVSFSLSPQATDGTGAAGAVSYDRLELHVP
jgi:hypothetical protein